MTAGAVAAIGGNFCFPPRMLEAALENLLVDPAKYCPTRRERPGMTDLSLVGTCEDVEELPIVSSKVSRLSRAAERTEAIDDIGDTPPFRAPGSGLPRMGENARLLKEPPLSVLRRDVLFRGPRCRGGRAEVLRGLALGDGFARRPALSPGVAAGTKELECMGRPNRSLAVRGREDTDPVRPTLVSFRLDDVKYLLNTT